MKRLLTTIDAYFGVTAAGSRLAIEARAGLTTFLTMAYILFVNPMILGQAIQIDGQPATAQLLTATALAAGIGSLLMGVWARYPFAIAPGMGINAYFTYSVVLGHGVPWQTALGAVFIGGLVFLVLSVTGIREAIINAVPQGLKTATSVGIGLFLAIIGANAAGLIQAHPVTLVQLGNLTSPGVLIALFGLLVTACLLALRVRGALLLGIIASTLAAIACGAPVYAGKAFAGLPGGIVQAPTWPTDLFLAMDLQGALALGVWGIVFMFLFVDLFDTAGTLFGLATKSGYLNADGRLPRAEAAFSADATSILAGAALGTSSTTAYVESAAGIEDGGRTGLTAVVVALLFFASLFLSGFVAAVPAVATAPVLILVGAMMMSHVGRIDWQDYREAIPAFLTIVFMPLTYSIANGIAFGIIAYTAMHLLTGKSRGLPWLMPVLAGLLIARYVYLGGH